MLAVQRTPEWKEYMRNQSIQPKQFAMGGKIKKYEDGGYYDKNNPYFMKAGGPVARHLPSRHLLASVLWW